MKYSLALIIMTASIAHGGELVLRDSDCKLLGPDGVTVKVIQGDKAEYTCVIIGNEATCNYRDTESGKGQGKPTKYEIVEFDGRQIWSNESGNIKLLIDEKKKNFIYGMAVVLPEKATLLTKHCVGKVVRSVK